jgi:Protein of unknown function (DUF2628)/Pilin (bacterial filament)
MAEQKLPKLTTRVRFPSPAPTAFALPPLADSIHMPWDVPGAPAETVVPPALAVLYRVAVGPAADYYVPRFMRFERRGFALPGWHWPALLAPAVWAFYRKLWLPGIAYALLTLAGLAGFLAIEADLSDSDGAWLACGAALVWLLPGIVAAPLANSHLYRNVKRLVAMATARSLETAKAARLLSARRPTDLLLAVVCALTGTLTASFLAPHVYALYENHSVRARLAQSLAAIKPLQREIEESWERSNAIPRTLEQAAAALRTGGDLVDSVNFNPLNGRLRVALGAGITELAGKNILLAPVVDAAQGVQWLCIPVDIAPKYLPWQCRRH